VKKPIQCYKDLTVWQRAVELFVVVTRLCRRLSPADRSVFETQMRKAARSVSSNISEGHERHDLGDYLRQLSFASGSLAEVENDVGLIRRTTSGLESELDKCEALTDEVGRMLTTMNAGLRRRWKRRKGPSP
jgi:four helix bundle protein